MLKRRAKRRYLSILHLGEINVADSINKRCSELFGSIEAEKAAISPVKSEKNQAIIKCRLDNLDAVLVAIAFTDPPVTTLDMSGSMKRLKRRDQSLS